MKRYYWKVPILRLMKALGHHALPFIRTEREILMRQGLIVRAGQENHTLEKRKRGAYQQCNALVSLREGGQRWDDTVLFFR